MATPSSTVAGKLYADSAVPRYAIVVLTAGITAAWIAAGSSGLLGDPFRRSMTSLALAVALVAGWPRQRLPGMQWAMLIAIVMLGNFMTAAIVPAVNILAVTLVLSVLSRAHAGLPGRVILLGALATGALGLFRLATDSIPSVWLAADTLGRLQGNLAARLTGRPLWIGASFGGVDFLVLMGALTAGWLAWTRAPRLPRACYAAMAILAGQLLYLAALAFSNDLLAVLPAIAMPPEIDGAHLGIWSWSNAVRTLLPWNVPIVGIAIHALLAGWMVRWGAWCAVAGADEPALAPAAGENGPRRPRPRQGNDRRRHVASRQPLSTEDEMMLRLVPWALAGLLPVVVMLAPSRSVLDGKTVVAYEKGNFDWSKPQHDNKPWTHSGRSCGMLPVLVESLGGQFVRSASLAQDDLDKADVLLLIHPDRPWLDGQQERIWEFVRRGGSLLVAAGPRTQSEAAESPINKLLEPTSIEVRYDVTVPKTGRWEGALQALAHASTERIGRGRFGFGIDRGSSIRTSWPAAPLLFGRWGWAEPGSDSLTTAVARYDPGEKLGDLVLAAQQKLGQGIVLVLADANVLANEATASDYPFLGRLLGCLAGKESGPPAWWRQLLGMAILAGLVAAVVWRPDGAWMTGTVVVLGTSMVVCTLTTHSYSEVLPDGRKTAQHQLACIDASHLEPYHRDFNHDDGLGAMLRTLMSNGYLPLLLPEVTPERLEGARLLVSIAPSKAFSADEQQHVGQFVRGGGIFISMVGAEESPPSAELLATLGLEIPVSPVPPSEQTLEPIPLGSFRQIFAGESDSKAYVEFYAGWPLKELRDNIPLVVWSDGTTDLPIVIQQKHESGSAVLIGDTWFAANKNLDIGSQTDPTRDNTLFWRWLLTRLSGRGEWVPPASRDKDEMVPNESLADPAKEDSP